MKNLFRKYTGILSLLSFLLILPIHYAYSEGIDNLFGIKLFDNATNYVSSEYIENNKYKHRESITGFWSLNISHKASSPYFDEFFITIDDFNVIHEVIGQKVYPSEDRCLTFMYKLYEQLETRKQIKFNSREDDYGDFKVTQYGAWKNNVHIGILCHYAFDPVDNTMVYHINSKTLSDAKVEYYNQD